MASPKFTRSPAPIFMAAILALSLTFCAKAEPTENTPTEPGTSAAETTGQNSSAVSDYVSLRVDRSDKYELPEHQIVDYKMRLPELHLSPELDEAFKEEIDRLYLNPGEAQIEENNAVFQISYTACLTPDNILSITISRHEGFSSTNYIQHSINYDTTTKTRLTLENALTRAGFGTDPLARIISDTDTEFHYDDDGSLILLVLKYFPGPDTYSYRSYNLRTLTMDDQFEGEQDILRIH